MPSCLANSESDKEGYRGLSQNKASNNDIKILSLLRCLFTVSIGLLVISVTAGTIIVAFIFTGSFHSTPVNAAFHKPTTNNSLKTDAMIANTTTQPPFPIDLTLNLPYKPRMCLGLLNNKDRLATINFTAGGTITFNDLDLPDLKISIRRNFEHPVRGCCTNYHTYRFEVRLPESEVSKDELYLTAKCGEPVTVTALKSTANESLRDVLENTIFLPFKQIISGFHFIRLRSFMPVRREWDEYGCYLQTSSDQLITSNKSRFLDYEVMRLGGHIVTLYDFKLVEVDC